MSVDTIVQEDKAGGRIKAIKAGPAKWIKIFRPRCPIILVKKDLALIMNNPDESAKSILL